MSDHQIGTSEYYLESILNDIGVLPDLAHEIRDEVERILNDNRENNGNVLRILDGMRALLNLENEAMVMLRDIRREHDAQRYQEMKEDFTFIIYRFAHYVNSPDFVRDFISDMDVLAMHRLGDICGAVLTILTKEAEKRAKVIDETRALVAVDKAAI